MPILTSNEEQYLGLLRRILLEGDVRSDRTGVGTIGLFGAQLDFDVGAAFPLLTTKKMAWKSIVHELLWFISGSTNARDLQAKGVTIWDEWATAEQCEKFGRAPGDLGPVYGHQWRNFGATPSMVIAGDGTVKRYSPDGVDQLRDVVKALRSNPMSRRHIVTGWNPKEASQVALPPCHTLFQFYVGTQSRLSCHMYQRSADAFLGLPFNIASYALLLKMMAATTQLEPHHLIISLGDVHVYSNHQEQVRTQLTRAPLTPPEVAFRRTPVDIDGWEFEDIQLLNYAHYPSIAAPVAI